MHDEPHELLEAVVDEASFLKFVVALREDREAEVSAQKIKNVDSFGRGPNDWENHTIEAFLEAASSWAEDSDFGKTQGLTDANPWKKFAVFLYCGKIYE
jgi:hypothetical protein